MPLFQWPSASRWSGQLSLRPILVDRFRPPKAKEKSMHEFPGEQLHSTEVRTALADLFSFAEALLNFWLDLDKSRWTTSVPMQSANLALILDAQACRLLRSVIEQCQRADGFT